MAVIKLMTVIKFTFFTLSNGSQVGYKELNRLSCY